MFSDAPNATLSSPDLGTGSNVKPEAPAAKKPAAKKPAAKKAPAKKAPTASTATKATKGLVKTRITAPARLAKLQEQRAEGKVPHNIAISTSGGKFTAYEWVEEK